MTGNDLTSGLVELGLKTGDVLIVHRSVAGIGAIDGGVDTLLVAFMELLGQSCTLFAPVFGDLVFLRAR